MSSILAGTEQVFQKLHANSCDVQLDLGFDTVGNATAVVYDQGPLLVTDPWLGGDAYFGSWGLSYQIPEAQRTAIKSCEFVWLSHGHPDHLHTPSLELLRDKTLLLPDHVGGKIREDLIRAGYQVRVLPDRTWMRISDRVRVFCIADANQDGVLLIDVGGVLLVNLNDAVDHGWWRTIRQEVRNFRVSFMLALAGYGDADMINIYGEDGVLIPPPAASRTPFGGRVARRAESLGAKFVVPFSSSHRYQRSDSVWANTFSTPIADHAIGFESNTCELLPAFVRYDVSRDQVIELNPQLSEPVIYEPSTFGDNWSDTLSSQDLRRIKRYFWAFEHLSSFLDFVAFRVGGETYTVDVGQSNGGRGITFDVPRGSLMKSVEWEVFDDLLIGNFMKTTLHGKWNVAAGLALYPDFSPYVAKYGDNGRAHSRLELSEYFSRYRQRAGIDYLRYQFESRAVDKIRSLVPLHSGTWKTLRTAYWALKSA